MGTIGLNPIRLDRIGLDPIRVNAIRLGVPGAASGFDRPYIDPEVLASLKAVCICYGKSNDDPDRAVVKNLVDPDNPFVISNAAYTEGSGYADKDSPYYGAFVTDGVGDLITSTNTVQEMLEGSNEITIVSMVHQVKDTANNVSFTNYIRGSANGYFRNIVNNYGKTGIYGYTSSDLRSLSVINNILGDKNDYTSNGDNRDTIINGNFSVQGYSYNNSSNTGDFSSVAWYWTVIANKVLTTDQINQVIAYFNLDRCVEPTVWYDVQKQGLTNETPAADWYLKDYSGNGYDMTLYKYAKTPESGINADGGLQSDGVDDYGKVTGLPIYKDYTVVADREIISKKNAAATVTKGTTTAVGAFSEEIYSTTVNSYGANTGAEINPARVVFYGSKYAYKSYPNTIINLEVGDRVDGDNLYLATVIDNDYRFGNIAIWSLLLFPYSLSEFLIERQLKKRKAGTLYPDMVEFRPKIKSDERIKSINYYIGLVGATVGQYYPIGSGLGIAVETVEPYVVNSLKVNGVLAIPNADHKGFNSTLDSKSPQNITMDIGVDSTLVQWNPSISSNAEYQVVDFYIDTLPAVVGNYYPINSKLRIAITTKGAVDEVTSLKVNGVDFGTPSINNNRFTFNGTLSDKSPQKVDITIDEYIRYEDIVQPYPQRANLKQGDKVITWGDKLKVGSKVLYWHSTNLLPDLYSISGSIKYNNKQINTNTTIVVEKSMVFTPIQKVWLLGRNIPKCILSPSRLRIPNSSYKILGYIPDLSGNENHGIINNSAYAEGSGVNADGSYQLDGVDDFISIPTTVGGKQVLMKVNWQNDYDIPGYMYDSNIVEYRNYIIKGNKEQIAYENASKTYIDGILNANLTSGDLKDITHNITSQFNETSSTPYIGCRYSLENFLKMSLYDFMLFDEISTDEEIAMLNEYIGIEPKVTIPPYYWDAYGKANNDVDDIEGNHTRLNNKVDNSTDYQLVPYNFAWDEMSGYGGYSFKSFDTVSRWNVYDNTAVNGVEIVSRNGYSVTLKKKASDMYTWQFNYGASVNGLTEDLKFKFKCDKTIKIVWQLKYQVTDGEAYQTETLVSQEVEANTEADINLIHKTTEQLAELGAIKHYYLIYFNNAKLAIDEEYTITMLPLYPNGLCLDGVDDYLLNRNIPVFTDFTVISKRIWLEENTSNKPFIIKGDTLYPDGIKNAFLFEYGKLSTYCFGQNNKYDESVVPSLISYATKQSYNGVVSLVKGSATDTIGLDIAHNTRMVFYKLMLYPKTLTNLEIMFLKNMFEKDEIIDLTNPIFIKE